MVLTIYDASGTKAAPLTDYDPDSLSIKRSLAMADAELTMTVPILSAGALVCEGYIETDDDRFVIKSLSSTSDGAKVEVIAQRDFEALEGKAFTAFASTEQTLASALRTAIAGTGWTLRTVGTMTKKRTLSLANASPWQIIKQALSTYRCEMSADCKHHILTFAERIGSDRGAYATDRLNLRKLTATRTTYDFYTEIEPYGKDGMTIASVNDGKTYLTDYSYSAKKKRIIWKDERYTVPESLKEDAQAKLKEMAHPVWSYEADIRDLAAESPAYSVLDFGIGDTITLLDSTTGTHERQRIVTLTEYPDRPEKDTCEICNTTLSFSELAEKYGDTADTVDNITTDNGTVDGSKVDSIDADTQLVNTDQMVARTAAVQDLTAKTAHISDDLTAARASIGDLSAQHAAFEDATVKHLDATDANVSKLKSDYIDANAAKIKILDADYANIKNLLSGTAGVGDLQAIKLTAQNATIDSALIATILANNATVRALIAGQIDTDEITIGSGDGSFTIHGSTMQVTDSKGHVRIQLGRDGNGDFTFTLFDPSGSGVLLDSTGVKAAAIADGLIVDDMVAEDAGIKASKLNIDSLFDTINADKSHSVKGSKVFLDEAGQTLTQVYTDLRDSTKAATQAAENATKTAGQALSALSGIQTLSAFTASLSNDAHVVHTAQDGSGGDYTDCRTTVTAYVGDTDVTDQASINVSAVHGVVGAWNAKTHTYQVTGMTDDNGYVDFDIIYGSSTGYLLTPDSKVITMPDGAKLVIEIGQAAMTKRFSVSKARDGAIGSSYQLVLSSEVMQRRADGTLFPSTLKVSAVHTTGITSEPYLGRYRIEESTSGGSTIAYTSTEKEASVLYAPKSGARGVTVMLLDASGTYTYDIQSVAIVADAEELQGKVAAQESSIQTIQSDMTTVQSGLSGLNVRLASMQTELAGVSAGDVLYQVPYTVSDGKATFTAAVYKSGVECHTSYDPSCFTWYLKSEAGTVKIGTGYSVTVNVADAGYGGFVVGIFETQ